MGDRQHAGSQHLSVAAERLEGLLVDFGGVLTTNVFDSFRSFCEAEGIDPDTVKRLFREDPRALAELRRLEVGELNEEQFAERFGPLLGIEETAGLVDRLFAGLQPDQAMLAAVERARASGVRTGLVSNSWGAGRYDRDALPRLFDGVVISGEVGLHKPQPEIFELGAKLIGLDPSECVFVDDLGFNLKPAEELGMATVLHTDAAQTAAELEKLLGVALT